MGLYLKNSLKTTDENMRGSDEIMDVNMPRPTVWRQEDAELIFPKTPVSSSGRPGIYRRLRKSYLLRFEIRTA